MTAYVFPLLLLGIMFLHISCSDNEGDEISKPIGGIILRKRNFRTITLFLLPESANGMWITGLQLINLP